MKTALCFGIVSTTAEKCVLFKAEHQMSREQSADSAQVLPYCLHRCRRKVFAVVSQLLVTGGYTRCIANLNMTSPYCDSSPVTTH